MKAMPPRKYQPSHTSAAATALRASPVSEIALGVRRDSMRRLRAPARRSATSAAARWVRVSVMKEGNLGEGPGARARAGHQAGAVVREAGGAAAEERVGEEVVAVHDDPPRDEQRVGVP